MCRGSYQKLLCQFLFAGDTEELNRRWYEANTGQVLTDVQQEVRHPTLRWMAATLDGRVAPGSPRRPALLGRSGGVFVLSREPNALEVLDRRKPQERKRRLSLAAGSFGELVRASRIAQRDQAAVGFASV